MNFSFLANFLLSKSKVEVATTRCLIGFDGFIDEICYPVEKSFTKNNFYFQTITSFAKKLHLASHKSCNIELEQRLTKIGGNALLLAAALIEGNHHITLAATLGNKKIDPLFLPLTKRCQQVINLGLNGHSDALEFSDGKIILGKLRALKNLSYQKVVKKIDPLFLLQTLETIDLFVCANWTMLPMMNPFWAYLNKKIIPFLTKRKRILFVDLADPAKRADEDLLKAIYLLQTLSQKFQVVQGLNQAEAFRLAKILKVPFNHCFEELSLKLLKATKFHQIVIHSAKNACLAYKNKVFSLPSFYTEKTAVKTGAGDHFNGGYCNGLLYNLSPKNCLLLGLATAGFYVRQGKSPTLKEVATFLMSKKSFFC